MKITTAKQSQWTMWSYLENPDFAGNIVVLSKTQTQTQTKLTKLATTATTTGLHINKQKTKVMSINLKIDDEINLDGETLEEVEVHE